MNGLLAEFHFLRPWWLVLLLALPVLLWLAARRDVSRLQLSRLVDAALLPHLLTGRPRQRALPLGLFAAGWLLASLALAGPTWSRVAQPLYAERAAQVVAVSLSRHMLSQDQAPSRMDRARYKAHALLAANADGLNGLVGYAGEAFVVAPLTSDAHSLDDLLDALAPDTMPVDGDDAADAIAKASDMLHHAKAAGGSLVVISDHVDDAAISAARQALAGGLHVSVLGVGTRQGTPVPAGDGSFLRNDQGSVELAPRDDRSLAALAAAGGGRYVAMTDGNRDIQALHEQLQHAQPSATSDQRGDEWQDRGPWLVLPLLLLAASAFRRGWLLMLPLVLAPVLWTPPVQAASWKDWWLRPDQQAARALQQGQPKQAQQLARDPALRGAAAYKAGDFPAATSALQPLKSSDGQYNLGNALAKQGQYQAAIQAYDHALKADPKNADALANRQAVEDWLKKNPPKDSKNGQGGKGQGGKGGKSGQNQQGRGQNQQGQGQGQNQQGQNPPPADPSKQDPSKQDDPNQGQSPDKADNSGKDGQSDGDKNQPAQPGPATSSSSGKPGDAGQAPPLDAKQQAQQQAQAAQAQQALRKQMDQALAGQGKADQDKNDTHQLGTVDADDPQSKLPPELRQALQRVPDDPGALLRRKFELEYRQRQGDVPQEDAQP